MNKNPFFIAVLVICTICLILGLFTPAKNSKYKNVETKQGKTKIDNIINQNTNKIAIIRLDGVISSNEPNSIFAEDNSSVSALKALNKAEYDNNIKGIILRINSPGGTVGMSQRLYSAVINARKNKPVVAVMDDIATSGGYYVASAADRIVSLPGTMTGSIGVIMSTMDLHRLLSEKLAVNENVIKSGKYKDIGSSTRAMTADERSLLQDVVNDSYSQFKEAIINGRIQRVDEYSAKKVVLTKNNLNKYADGRVFTGRQALKYGFVDSNGGMREAQTMIQKMAAQKFQKGDENSFPVTYVDYSTSSNFLNMLGIKSQSSAIQDFLPQSMKYAGKPLYLWE